MAVSIIFPRTTELVPVNTGDITVEVTPPTDVNTVNVHDTTVVDFSIAAGKVRLKIENRGGDTPATIQVNGDDVPFGGVIEDRISWDGVNRYLPPAYAVVTNGSLVFYSYDEE